MDMIDATVREVLQDVAEDDSRQIGEIELEHRLVEDLGFDSLTMARIIAILEHRFSVDPFSTTVAITSIRTAGDLAGAYRQCLRGEQTPSSSESRHVQQSRQRAASRLDALGQAPLRRRAA
jgi:acyl carrier protein